MHDVLVIGAGPSGLAAGREAVLRGGTAIVLEALDQVGGLSRTLRRGRSLYDIGPHRFFTKNEEVRRLFAEVVGADLVRVPRQTRIFYRGRYFNYPLTPMNALVGMGGVDAAWILASFLGQQLRRTWAPRQATNFEEWVTDRFGVRLFECFFRHYTEKVWGIACKQIGADWAAQRIKGLDLTQALRSAVLRPKQNGIKTLVSEFLFPRLGAGQFYEKMADEIERLGGALRLGCKVVEYRREGFRLRHVTVKDAEGRETELEAQAFLSSAPLTEILAQMNPAPPPEVQRAARGLRYRNHIGVNLLVQGQPFPDNWIYVHDPDLRLARIANYRNFSPEMAGEAGTSPLTLEYFSSPGDGLWEQSDARLVERASGELRGLRLGRCGEVVSSFVVRSRNAYPVAEIGTQEKVELIRSWLDQFENLWPIGRSGLFKYNNQDHAIATGLLAARSALGVGRFDPWRVNIDAEYHESGAAK